MNKHKEEHEIVCQSTVEALFTLMDQKPFSEITITELINKAGIARTTYYRNYTSKEDVLSNYLDGIFHDFNNEFPVKVFHDRCKDEHILHIMEYILRYEKQLKILHKSGLSSIYLERINNFLIECCCSKVLSEKEIFEIYAFAGAQFNVIFNWLISNSQLSKYDIVSLIKKSLK